MRSISLRSPHIITAGLAAVLLGCASPSSTAAQNSPNGQMSPWGDFLAGYHAEASGDQRGALMFYDAALNKGLEASPDLHSRLYILNLTEGRLDGALAALQKVEDLGGTAPLANLARAVRALRDGDFDKAEALLGSEDGGITRFVGPVMIAWARVGRGDMEGAREALDAMSENGEPSPLQILHTALIAERAGNLTDARERYLKLKAEGGLSVRSTELVGAFLERQGNTEGAREVYDALGQGADRDILISGLGERAKAGDAPKPDVTSAQDGAAEALYGVASVLLAQSAWESAVALAYMADDLRADFPPALLVAATALEQNGRRADANALYERVPTGSPFSWMARLRIADNLDRLDQTDRAVKVLSDMALERPDLARPLIELGDVLRRHERFSEAANAYTNAIARIDVIDETHWGIFYSRGIAFEQTKRWPQAEEDFLKALELSPDQPLVLNYLGYSWIDQGLHLERALKMIETAVEKRPRDGYIVDSLGWGLYRLGDYAGAVKHLERAVMLRPADPIINDHLGDALWQVGRVREARFQWERALSMEPDADLAKTIAKKLKDGLAQAKP